MPTQVTAKKPTPAQRRALLWCEETGESIHDLGTVTMGVVLILKARGWVTEAGHLTIAGRSTL